MVTIYVSCEEQVELRYSVCVCQKVGEINRAKGELCASAQVKAERWLIVLVTSSTLLFSMLLVYNLT